MSYEVDSRNEVRHRLHELGVDSVRDVRRAGGARHHDVPGIIQAEQLSLRADGSPDSMAAVTEDLLEISRHIGAVRDAVHGVLGDVRKLGGHQHDGWGPIADRMANCMTDRADSEGGAARAMDSYLTELADLDAVLTRTAALYAENEQNAVARMRKAADGDLV